MKLAADIVLIPRPDNPSIRFQQDWLDGNVEGAKFLRGDEAFAYHPDFRDDFVALLPSSSWLILEYWISFTG